MRVEQSEEEETISYYLMGHYNWQRPHQFNDDVPPAKAEIIILPSLNTLNIGKKVSLNLGISMLSTIFPDFIMMDIYARSSLRLSYKQACFY